MATTTTEDPVTDIDTLFENFAALTATDDEIASWNVVDNYGDYTLEIKVGLFGVDLT